METLSFLAYAFDGLLCVSLLLIAWMSLASQNLFKAIVLFVTFGLLMALAWVRLNAPDVAMAEVAIGAGLTGALLLASLARLREISIVEIGTSNFKTNIHHTSYDVRWPLFIFLVILAMGLGYAIFSLPEHAVGLQKVVEENLERSGVSNPVTGVLLNFRAYDTLLEMIVLLVALLGIWALEDSIPHTKTILSSPVLDALTGLLVPLLILVAAYLLWVGAHAPGGAFQAGSVLGAAGVLLLLSGWQLRKIFSSFTLRFILVAGSALFLAVAALSMLITGRLLEYPPAQASSLIFMLESVATVSIGVTLITLFLSAFWEKEDKK